MLALGTRSGVGLEAALGAPEWAQTGLGGEGLGLLTHLYMLSAVLLIRVRPPSLVRSLPPSLLFSLVCFCFV